MASRFQSRLVGTVVLVALGVIILPDILDGQKSHYKEDVASIPLKPDVEQKTEQYQILEPETDQLSVPDSPVSVQENTDETSANDTVAVQVQTSSDSDDFQSSGWIIQLMALKNSDNAKKLVADLQKRGYQAHTKQENGYTRVIIGPDVSKSKMERQLAELEKITGAKGQLLKFKPLNP
ncbi:SPOR domain-containing protein [Vibrio ruber]|uniref:Cell division protein DedD n=1 Tax=Vibrio ruber (strain DSM 16370 / JCM 11486 / BCRC 17186 / CECT 7878 / LMG 23124 / VR1) TaxID=1123498 RepID=A0A1R4LTM7_VIBR1|nr:SPOR domain-containing protein [Vibrio ruber]WNJ95766.1 SPOR domain-containing protein [Vibrio ruber]SJN59951.1 cell division protein DedD [Vibrio ruber DSM 16370]